MFQYSLNAMLLTSELHYLADFEGSTYQIHSQTHKQSLMCQNSFVSEVRTCIATVGNGQWMYDIMLCVHNQ